MENKEILFENSHVRDKDTLKEVYKHEYFGKTIDKVALILILVALVLQTALSIWEYVATGYWFMDYKIMGILIVFPVVFYLVYRMTVKTTLKRDIELFGKPLSGVTKVTCDSIITEAELAGNTETGLDKIKCAHQTKNLILVRTKARLIFIFRKDGFSIGTKEDFVAFMKNKGIKIRGK